MPDPKEKDEWKTEAEQLKKDLEAIRGELKAAKPADLGPLQAELAQLRAELKALSEKPGAEQAIKPLQEKLTSLEAAIEQVKSHPPTSGEPPKPPAKNEGEEGPQARKTKITWV